MYIGNLLLIFTIPIFCTFKCSQAYDNKELGTLFSEINDKVNETRSRLQEFTDIFKITTHELEKFSDLKGEDTHTPANRFTQVSQIPNEYNIRESLYSTQLRRSQPQANVAIDVLENTNDVTNNAENVSLFSDDGTREFFEDELHRMKMEGMKNNQLANLEDQLKLLRKDIHRLMTPRPATEKPMLTNERKRTVESSAHVICDSCPQCR